MLPNPSNVLSWLSFSEKEATVNFTIGNVDINLYNLTYIQLNVSFDNVILGSSIVRSNERSVTTKLDTIKYGLHEFKLMVKQGKFTATYGSTVTRGELYAVCQGYRVSTLCYNYMYIYFC